jgi:hypothetical protein
METTHQQIDMAANNILTKVESFKTNSHQLQQEAFKIDSVLSLFNNCADRCTLQYRETGLKGENLEDVTCFKNCLAKSYSLS